MRNTTRNTLIIHFQTLWIFKYNLVLPLSVHSTRAVTTTHVLLSSAISFFYLPISLTRARCFQFQLLYALLQISFISFSHDPFDKQHISLSVFDITSRVRCVRSSRRLYFAGISKTNVSKLSTDSENQRIPTNTINLTLDFPHTMKPQRHKETNVFKVSNLPTRWRTAFLT